MSKWSEIRNDYCEEESKHFFIRLLTGKNIVLEVER